MDSANAEKPDNDMNETQESTADLQIATPSKKSDLDMILDIPLRVSVELGKTKILVQDLLKLHKGSVVELSKLAGDSLEVLVNEKTVARGEVIVVNEKFGLRLTEIVSHDQRIRHLGE